MGGLPEHAFKAVRQWMPRQLAALDKRQVRASQRRRVDALYRISYNQRTICVDRGDREAIGKKLTRDSRRLIVLGDNPGYQVRRAERRTGALAVKQAVAIGAPPGVTAREGRSGENDWDGCAAIDADGIQRARHVACQASDGIDRQVLARGGFRETTVQGAEDKDLVIGRETIAQYRHTLCYSLESIRPVGINSP